MVGPNVKCRLVCFVFSWHGSRGDGSHDSDSGMLGSWWNRTSPSSPDSNYLRVHNAYTNRRLSDNTLMAPKIKIAPSCASSPGGPGSPGGPLPIRRHSSFGPQERRGSTVNLSPPSVSTSSHSFTTHYIHIHNPNITHK